MFHALVVCSEENCAEVFEAWGTLEELQALACDCGCTLEILTLSEARDGDTHLELQPLG